MGSLRLELVLVVLSLFFFYLDCLGVEEVRGYPASVNCKSQECISYQVIHSQKEFEIRIYKNATWVSSGFITTVSYNIAYSAGFIDVYKFFRGDNVQRVIWNEQTQPVVTDIIPKTSYDSTYKTYLLVPQKYQNNLPTPFNWQDVTPVTLPPKKFAAVTRFGGYLTDKAIAAALAALKQSLRGTPWESAEASPNCTVADYQFLLFDQKNDRVNEVILWFDE